MKKAFLFLPIFISLTGCIPNYSVENPLNDLNQQQLAQVNTQQVCTILTNIKYIPSQKGIREAKRRGLNDCSNGELYCLNLGMKWGTRDYAHCRMVYDQQQIEQQNAAAQFMLQEQAIRQMNQPKPPQEVNVHYYPYPY